MYTPTEEQVQEALSDILDNTQFSYGIEVIDDEIIILHNTDSHQQSWLNNILDGCKSESKAEKAFTKYCAKDEAVKDDLESIGFTIEENNHGNRFDFAWKYTISIEDFLEAFPILHRKLKIEKLLNKL